MNQQSSNSITYDREYSTDIALFAETLMHGGVTEVRIVGAQTFKGSNGETWFGYFDDPSKLAQAVREFDKHYKPPVTYMLVNPCNPALLGRSNNKLKKAKKGTGTAKGDIPRLTQLYVDIDADKPSGTSATDEQMNVALKIRDKVLEYMKAHGFPDPIIMATGNGGALFFSIDLPNDKESTGLLKRVLQALQSKFPKVDTSVSDPNNLTKLCGTFSRKGEEVLGQKHRQSGFVLPDALEVTSRDVLEAFAAGVRNDAKPATGGDAQVKAVSLARQVCAQHKCTFADEPRDTLDSGALVYAFTSTNPVCSKHPKGPHKNPGDATLNIYPDGRIEFDCFHQGCAGHSWKHDFLMPLGVRTSNYAANDYGMAERVRDKVGDHYGWVPAWRKWLKFNGQVFVPCDPDIALNAVVKEVSDEMLAKAPLPAADNKEQLKAYKEFQSFCNKYQSASGYKAAEFQCRGLMITDPGEYDQQHTLLAVQNGVLNLATAKLEPFSTEYKLTKIAPVVFDRSAQCPRWIRFIDEITCGDKQLADYLQRICGYCISGLVEHEALFIMQGDGANGKSVFTNTLLKLLGDDYASPIRQDLLMDSPNDHPTKFATLHGKRCVIAQETDQDCRLNEAQVKALTGGDRIQCRRMREDNWAFSPTHKILMSTNFVPIIRGTDHGIWRRLRLVPFSARFEGTSMDPKLRSTLDSQLSGILNWCLEGFRNYQFDGLHEPPAVTKAREEYKAEMNVVDQFVRECCELKTDAEETNSALYLAFKKYCLDHGAYGGKTPSNRKFQSDLVKIKGITVGRAAGDNRERIKKGVEIKLEHRAFR